MPEIVTIESTVDPTWIEFCTKTSDVLRLSYCGSFLYGVMHDATLGWLVYEHGGERSVNRLPNQKAALAAWREKKPLPKHYYRLDLDLAKAAWIEGVKWRGESWYDKGDGPAYGYVIQKALFGEERYA